MTCIVGIQQDPFTVHMGADSASSNDMFTGVAANPKLFEDDGCLFMGCGSWRSIQLLQHHLTVPFIPPNIDALTPHGWMVRHFIPQLRTVLKDHGFGRKEHEVESGGYFIVAAVGRLFKVQQDYSVVEYAEGHFADGSGCFYALGSLHTTSRGEMKPHKRIRRALEAASHYDPFVRPPYRIASTTFDPVTRTSTVAWHEKPGPV
ncbi:MAG: hypothetical protein F4Z29_07410 [Gemmatimonadetes bacterium]|nr:hypothetical protein [Gemmatimonadota bacterium]